MEEDLGVRKPAEPMILKKFVKNGGDLASPEGIQLLNKYGCNAIKKIANRHNIRKQLGRAFNNAQGNTLLRRKILAAIAP